MADGKEFDLLNRNIMKSIIVTLLLFCMLTANAQNNRLWGGVEVGYGYSLAEKKDVHGISYPKNNSFSSIQAILGYYVVEKLSVGVGIGLNGYSNPGLNTLPLFLNLKFHPFHNKNIVFSGDLGYSLLSNEDNIDAGFLTNISVGYRLWRIRKISITPAVGYNFCQYSIKGAGKIKHRDYRNSIFLKLSIAY